MPHQVAGRRLGRTSSHRLHMLANLAVAVIRYERVKTTEAKAKEVRTVVDRMITTAKRGDLHARRSLAAQIPEAQFGGVEGWLDTPPQPIMEPWLSTSCRPGDASSVIARRRMSNI